jgi:hypothetical protein
MKIDTNQEYLNRFKEAKNKTWDNNDTNQDILIWFMINMIQGIMIRIKAQDQQETKAETFLDTRGGNRPDRSSEAYGSAY